MVKTAIERGEGPRSEIKVLNLVPERTDRELKSHSSAVEVTGSTGWSTHI